MFESLTFLFEHLWVQNQMKVLKIKI